MKFNVLLTVHRDISVQYETTGYSLYVQQLVYVMHLCWLAVGRILLTASQHKRMTYNCIRCGPDEERILDLVPREDGARNSG